MNLLDKLLEYADTYGSAIPLVTILLVFNKRKYPPYLIPLIWYFLLSILLFGYSNYLADRSINNIFLYNLFCPAELILLTWFFHSANPNKVSTWVPLGIIGIFISMYTYNLLYLESMKSFFSNMMAIEYLTIIFFCFYYYYQFSLRGEVIDFMKTPLFWIVSGFFLYFSLCIMVVVFYRYAAIQNREFVLNFWLIQVAMYLLKNLLITKGVLCFRSIQK